MSKLSIIITNRNTKEYLGLAVRSIFENTDTRDYELIIMDDNSSDGSKEWLNENRVKYNFTYHTHDAPERRGIVNIVQDGIDESTGDILFIGHSDMYYGKHWDTNLLKYLKPKTMITSTRIEPPIHGEEPCKIIKDFGSFPEEFNEIGFNRLIDVLQVQYKDAKTSGVFAPNMIYKSDWIGYDKTFIPQSREDDDMYFTMKEQGFEFIQSWESFVYHFTCRGSRFKDKSLTDSDEWKRSNSKNTKNFIRKWHSTPLHTEEKNPIIPPKIKLTASVTSRNEGNRIYNFLNEIEPYFDEIIIADDYSTDNTLEEIERYIKDTLEKSPTNFSRDKMTVFQKKLDNDFSQQINYITALASNDWLMKFDVDESMDGRSLNSIRFVMEAILRENPNTKVIGIPRLNILNGVLVNDIPRNLWTEEYLKTQEPFSPSSTNGLKNLDYQFRIFRKDVNWVYPVHEVPESVANKDSSSVVITHDFVLYHPKSVEKQNSQNAFYETITKPIIKKGKIKNINLNSVIYSFEGITKHPREEAKELKKLGYKIFINTGQFQSGVDDDMKNMYDVFDVNNPYINYINQPPIRENNPMFSVLGNMWRDNIVSYLSFEGNLPKDWSSILAHPNVKLVFTPSNYCKECFIKDGIPENKIRVIPHGVNPKVIKSIKPFVFDEFTMLWAGTTHNCLLPDALVSMSDGSMKEIQNITIDDCVISHDGSSRKIKDKWETVKNKLIHVKVQGLKKISGSSEHKLLVVPKQKMFSRIKKAGTKYKTCYKNTFSERDMIFKEMKDIVVGDFLVSRRNKNNTIDLDEKFNYNFGYLIGMLLADGNLIEDNIRWRRGIRFYQKQDNPVANKIITKIKEVCGVEPKVYERNMCTIFGNAKMLDICVFGRKYLDEFKKHILGNKCNNKEIKNLVEKTDCMKKGILEGFFDGDGCLDEQRNKRLTTTSKVLAYQLFQICQDLGLDVSLYERRNKTVVNNLEIFDVTISQTLDKKAQQKRSGDYIIRRVLSKEEECGLFNLIDICVEGAETFLANGFISHNSRKGCDLAIKSFLDEFEGRDDIQLVLKVNKIYDPKQDIHQFVKKHSGGRKTDNIKIIDENLSDDELYSIIKGAHIFVHPHRSEGFGILMLEALALGTPLIATKASGNMDFCNEDNTLFVDVKNKMAWAPAIFPYNNTKWFQPKIESLRKQMKYAVDNYESVKKKALEESEKILTKWTWENTAKLMDEAFSEL